MQSAALPPRALPQNLQDEAYTLAFYLCGHPHHALAVSEAAFAALAVAGWPSVERAGGDLRLTVLRQVLRSAAARPGLRPERAARWARKRDPLLAGLLALPAAERQALALVDMLGLAYADAARVLALPQSRVGPLLARARRALAAALESTKAGPLQPSQNGAPVSTYP